MRESINSFGIFKVPTTGVPGGICYKIENDTLRRLGRPQKKHKNQPLAVVREGFQGPDGKPLLVDDDHVLHSYVEVLPSRQIDQRWANLFAEIEELAPSYDVPEVAKGFDWIREIDGAGKIPSLKDMNAEIQKKSGFQLVPVMGLLLNDKFFKLLMEDKFPVTLSLRDGDEAQKGYTSFPDIFHDFAGHGIMFLNDTFSEFVRKIGALGWSFRGREELQKYVANLYWYTIEFGLKAEKIGDRYEDLRVYGAGIVSSSLETSSSIRDEFTSDPRDKKPRKINRLPFELERVLLSHYEFKRTQELYFVIHDYRQLDDLFRPDYDLSSYIVDLDRRVNSRQTKKIKRGTILHSERSTVIPARHLPILSQRRVS
jgi:phenylalanine-4-hydroxylase